MSESCCAVDVHTHVVPSSLPDPRADFGDIPWPSVTHTRPCHAEVIIRGKNYRSIEDGCWHVGRRVEQMTRMKVGVQVLSPMPELLSYWLAPEPARLLARHINETIADMVRAEPTRFHGLGMVPLQDISLAVNELEYLMRQLGLRGVEIATNINGVSLGDPSLDPFFAAAESLGATIFVHPLRPVGLDRLLGPASLEQVVAFPGETALCIASVITGGLLKRHPRLRLGFSHGGGSFAQVLSRLQHAWTLPTPMREAFEEPRATARRLFYDTLVYDHTTLKFLVDSFGLSQLMIGSDYPFAIMDTMPTERVAKLALSDAETAQLLYGNALRFLGLPSPDDRTARAP
ncbi:MAG: amidohydrolase [Rhodospirillales bacterium]|nr:amidohydrolase [Rhodospirillales bacterium]